MRFLLAIFLLLTAVTTQVSAHGHGDCHGCCHKESNSFETAPSLLSQDVFAAQPNPAPSDHPPFGCFCHLPSSHQQTSPPPAPLELDPTPLLSKLPALTTKRKLTPPATGPPLPTSTLPPLSTSSRCSQLCCFLL